MVSRDIFGHFNLRHMIKAKKSSRNKLPPQGALLEAMNQMQSRRGMPLDPSSLPFGLPSKFLERVNSSFSFEATKATTTTTTSSPKAERNSWSRKKEQGLTTEAQKKIETERMYKSLFLQEILVSTLLSPSSS
eukprot:TRINITY_DN5435_c0_g1_i3.p1 TRINITY_DN5435_c0_g1~~TRINITY_DN5435_c0_g1_i3.p1  ORF type:complete len:133 (-),score=38.32 TRINITY_DN5435_c0_g1_i3:60-458(-)